MPDLDDLGQKLDQISEKARVHELAQAAKEYEADNMGKGIRAGAELVTPIIAGGLIGWLADQGLHTKPVFLIIMLLLGVVTGFVNVWRLSQNIGSSVGFSELHRRKKDATNAPEE